MLKYLKKKRPKPKTSTPLQILDLLQISRKEKECRVYCRSTMRQFYLWKRAQKADRTAVQLYDDIEGILLRRRVQDALILYRIVRRHRMRTFDEYMEKLPARNNNFSVAQ